MAGGAISKLYLIAYNLACIAGWGYCLFLSVNAWRDGISPTQLWVELELPLVVRDHVVTFYSVSILQYNYFVYDHIN